MSLKKFTEGEELYDLLANAEPGDVFYYDGTLSVYAGKVYSTDGKSFYHSTYSLRALDDNSVDIENFEGLKRAIPGYSTGTKGTKYSNIALTGEQGPELQVMPKGTGVIPNPVTKNLWEIGQNPQGYISRFLNIPSINNKTKEVSKNEVVYSINGMTVYANNADEFVTSINARFKNKAIQETYRR